MKASFFTKPALSQDISQPSPDRLCYRPSLRRPLFSNKLRLLRLVLSINPLDTFCGRNISKSNNNIVEIHDYILIHSECPFNFRVILKQEPNEDNVAEAIELLSKNLDVYEGILRKNKYLAGDVSDLSSILPLPKKAYLTA